MQMLIFISIGIIFILAQGGFMFFFFRMISHGGMLDVIFGWQKMLDKLYGSKLYLLGKALGNCELCTCFWWALPSFFMFRWFTINSGYYPNIGLACSITVMWVFWCIAAFFSYYFVIKTNSENSGL